MSTPPTSREVAPVVGFLHATSTTSRRILMTNTGLVVVVVILLIVSMALMHTSNDDYRKYVDWSMSFVFMVIATLVIVDQVLDNARIDGLLSKHLS